MQRSSPEREMVERLAEEFVERYRQGERPPLTEYTERYPDQLADTTGCLSRTQLRPPSIFQCLIGAAGGEFRHRGGLAWRTRRSFWQTASRAAHVRPRGPERANSIGLVPSQ
jgi:hypothetical protein